MDFLYQNQPYRLNPFLSIIIAFILAYIPFYGRIACMIQKNGGKIGSIANSRAEAEKVGSAPDGARVAVFTGAHINGLEALIYYSIAIMAAVVTKVPNDIIERAATAFIAVRVIYLSVYLGPLNGPLRSLVWGGGVAISLDLLYRAAMNHDRGV